MEKVILFKEMTAEDIPLMEKWLQSPPVYEFYGGKPMEPEAVRKKYNPRILGSHFVRPYIFLYDGTPAGYLQKYKIEESQSFQWGFAKEESIIGIDCFIGESELFNKGIGTKMVKEFINQIIQEDTPSFIVLDPSMENKRAVRCYEKAGFKKRSEINEGTSLLMEINCSLIRLPHSV
ncbi:GNAT family N-acetyltransferase [Rossellomorea vietnamensis]|uniref:GNAT family N-acetyltransferase n=1 Tax=Rossellomorea vietnamensis TaxID=218284 RepID=A0A5D4KIG2_9BACI|nr:GNAT family N-acetyltransferase [Rossellomorea vietnamensis]TYR76639.1 GNAT family N-acetyltransferase [Rossellomorea vietnamensis]